MAQPKPPTVRLKGAFINGLWHCDCNPRLPAEHFQTKNGGKNHGRWFHTCQQAQNRRCGFFLWSDEAKHREEAAVLGGGRTEPAFKPAGKDEEGEGTGAKKGRGADRSAYELVGSFPNLNAARESRPGGYKSNRAFASHGEEEDDGEVSGWSNGPLEYPPRSDAVKTDANTRTKTKVHESSEVTGWSNGPLEYPPRSNGNGADAKGYESSDDEEQIRPTRPSTPRKERRLEGQTSPSKNKSASKDYGIITPQTTRTTNTRSGTDTATAKTISRLDLEHDPSFETPTPRHFHDVSVSVPTTSTTTTSPSIEPPTPASLPAGPPPLAKEILMLLSDSDLRLTPYIIEAVNRLCRTAQLREHGFMRGRDVVRGKLQDTEKEVARLSEKVRRLEMDLKVKGEVNAALRKELERVRGGK